MCADRATFLKQRKEQPNTSLADARTQSGLLLPTRLGSLGGSGAEKALAQARQEQLTLVPAKRASNNTGFEGVSSTVHPTSGVVTYTARRHKGGRKYETYRRTTAEEAALALARAVAAATLPARAKAARSTELKRPREDEKAKLHGGHGHGEAGPSGPAEPREEMATEPEQALALALTLALT